MNGFEKDNENPYRLYRVVSVKKIDRWFFEKHNHRRTHAKIYETVIRPKFGICENTFLDYRHSLMLWDAFDSAFKCILKEELACRINAEKLLKYLIICLGEKSPVVVR